MLFDVFSLLQPGFHHLLHNASFTKQISLFGKLLPRPGQT